MTNRIRHSEQSEESCQSLYVIPNLLQNLSSFEEVLKPVQDDEKERTRHSELACSATPHPALTLGLSLQTSSSGPASFQSIGPETSSGRRLRKESF